MFRTTSVLTGIAMAAIIGSTSIVPPSQVIQDTNSNIDRIIVPSTTTSTSPTERTSSSTNLQQKQTTKLTNLLAVVPIQETVTETTIATPTPVSKIVLSGTTDSKDTPFTSNENIRNRKKILNPEQQQEQQQLLAYSNDVTGTRLNTPGFKREDDISKLESFIFKTAVAGIGSTSSNTDTINSNPTTAATTTLALTTLLSMFTSSLSLSQLMVDVPGTPPTTTAAVDMTAVSALPTSATTRMIATNIRTGLATTNAAAAKLIVPTNTIADSDEDHHHQ
jgi:hypothetical protein